MKNLWKYGVLFFLVFVFFVGNAMADHKITPFRDNKAGALSITLDDLRPSQLTTGLAALSNRQLRATFFAVTNSYQYQINKSLLNGIAMRGHEIGSHSVNHIDLTAAGVDYAYEMAFSWKTITAEISAQQCISFAYPYGRSNDAVEAEAQNYYLAARSIWVPEGGNLNYYEAGSDYEGSWGALNFMHVGSAPLDGLSVSDPEVQSLIAQAERRHGWLNVLFHDVDDASHFGEFLDSFMKRNLWIDTFGNVAKYMKERRQCAVWEASSDQLSIRLQLDCALESDIYNVPLTVRSTVPSSWTAVNVTQGSFIQTPKPVVEGTETVVYYSVVPNGGNIVLSTAATPAPAISRLYPGSVRAGSRGFYLYVYGSNFAPGAQVMWNTTAKQTYYSSKGLLLAWIPTQDIAKPGLVKVWVKSPTGMTSSGMPFYITDMYGNYGTVDSLVSPVVTLMK
jgi:peptidoglycan/xylan/chitin deacetylase (PgdA/CDA1 family)